MKSRLLTNLDAAIAAATQPVQADRLRAERAGLLARQGQMAEARAVLSALQAQYARQPDLLVSAWLSLAEGFVSYYSDLNRNARDKISRAYALSAPARDTRLRALSVAWLAHMDYVDHDLEAMARHIEECFELAEPEHHAARARVCLVVAQAYHFGGRFDAAQPWYAKTRQHANAEGDEAMLSAVMHNMAGLLGDESRQTVLRGVEDDSVTRRAMLGIESTGNFDALVGTGSLDALVPLMRAQVSSLQGRYAEAVALYEAHFSDGLLQGLDRMRSCLGADLAWCRLQLGQTEQALKDALAAEVSVSYDRDVDDRAAAHSRLALVFGQLGQAEAAARHKTLADIDWHTHERDQALAVALVDKALAKLRV
jgi:tetratricopeptide (TPR) repeat protein